VKRTTTAAAVLLAALATLTACSSSDSSDDKPAAPPYKITRQDTDGTQRTIAVEVTSTKDLRGVFDTVADQLTEDAGYFIEINCATGGTGTSDNRLANGKKAVGSIGAAATGLDDGKTEYAEQPNAKCPA
jgi:ABC-type oligopeptide transport system substrate-binding subunit